MRSWKSKLKTYVILRYRFPVSTLSTSIQDRTEPPGKKKKKKKDEILEVKGVRLEERGKEIEVYMEGG